MNCQKCGAELSKWAQSCGECGSLVSPPSDQDMEGRSSIPPTPLATGTPPRSMIRKVIDFIVATVIVLLALFILMLIIIPRGSGGLSLRKAREASLVANLHMIRNAVESFHRETGYYPKTLVALTKDSKSIKPSDFQGKLTVVPKNFIGPYLTVQGGVENLPTNPFANASATTADKHWKYKPATGEVRCGMGAATYPDRYTLDGKRLEEL